MMAKFQVPKNDSKQENDIAPCSLKFCVPDEFVHKLNVLYPLALATAKAMLKRRADTSSKYWKLVPCVVAKSLSAKYQRNLKCKNIKRLVIPICGDKGKQVKLIANG